MFDHLFAASGPSRSLLKRRRKRSQLELLESRWVLTAPTLGAIADVTLVAGAPLNIALDGFDADGDALSFSATASNGVITTYIPVGNDSLRLHVVQRDAQGNTINDFGIMEFELFNDLAPETVAHIKAYVEAGNYDGLTFHRVIQDFMIQGGDPNGNGSGDMGGQIDDEFDVSLRFTSKGILAMAKSGDDTGDSQFFITSADTRWLDFQHTIFGFQTKGDDVREQIDNIATGAGDKPVNSVVIASADIFHDVENGVLRLSAPIGTTGTYTVTVNVSDGNGGTAQRTFNVNVVADDARYNGKPYLKPIADINMTVGQTTTKTLQAVDAEGNPIAFWGYQAPAGIDFNYGLNSSNQPTKYLVVTPTDGTASAALNVIASTPGKKELMVLVLASTSSGENDADFDIQAININVSPDAPGSIDLLSASDNGASDSDNFTSLDNSSTAKKLTFKVSGVWQGATVQLKIGDRVIGAATAPAAASGATPVKVDLEITTDGSNALFTGVNSIIAVQTVDGLSSAFSTALNVTVNTPPLLPPISNQTRDEGETFSFSAAATDPDVPSRETLVYSLAAGAPAGATINPTTGLFQWTPTEAQGGQTYQFTINVVDSFGATASQSFTLTVNEVNQPPVFNPLDPITLNAGETVTRDFTAADADLPANTLTFKLADGSPAGASITEAGRFTFAADLSHAPGTVTVDVIVEDGQGGSVTQTLNITVKNGPTLNPIGDRTGVEGSSILFTATSPVQQHGTHVQFYLDPGAPPGAWIDEDSGAFEWDTTEADGGQTYTITVRAIDQYGQEATQTINITVTEQDSPPALPAVADQQVDEGDLLTVVLTATDPDLPANALIYSLEQAPAGAAISATGVLTWTPTEAQGGQQFTFKVRVVDDTGLADTVEFTVDVIDTNEAPMITPPPVFTIKAGETVEHDVVAADPDLPADTLVFSLINNPAPGATITPDGKFQYVTGASDFTATHSFTIQVDDGHGGITTQTLTVNVQQPPVLSVLGNREANEGDAVLLTATSTHVDPLKHVTYYLGPGAPANAFLDPDSGGLIWYTSEADGPGVHELTIIARDSDGLEDSLTIQITINEVNQAPTIDVIEPQTVSQGKTLSVQIPGADADLPEQALTYSLGDDAPAGVTIDPVTGVLSWSPDATVAAGVYSFTVQVADAEGLIATQTLEISVLEAEDPAGDGDSESDVALANSAAFPGSALFANAGASSSDPINDFNAFNALPIVVNTIGQGLGLSTPGAQPFIEVLGPQNQDPFFFRSRTSVNHLGADTGVGTYWTPGTVQKANRPISPPEGQAPAEGAGPAAGTPPSRRNVQRTGDDQQNPSRSAQTETDDAYDAAVAALVDSVDDLAMHGRWAGLAGTAQAKPRVRTGVVELPAGAPVTKSSSVDRHDATQDSDTPATRDKSAKVAAAAMSASVLLPLLRSEKPARDDKHNDPRRNRGPR